MASEKEIYYAELFLTVELDSSDSFCSHMYCAYTHRILAEHSYNLAIITVMSLIHFYYAYCLDIEIPKELNMNY